MSHVPDNLDAQLQAIDRLLSGALPEHEAQAERKRIMANPAMAALLLEQEQINSALTRNFTPPPMPPVVPTSPTSPGPAGGAGGAGTGLFLKWLAAVLMTVSTVVGAYYMLRPNQSESRLDVASAYQNWMAGQGNSTGNTPPPGDLQVMLASKLGRQINLPDTAEVKYLGAISLPQDTPLGVGIKMSVNGTQVLLAIDLAPKNESDSAVRTQTLDPSKGIYQHAQTRSGLRLYEVSKSSQTLVIPGIVIEKIVGK